MKRNLLFGTVLSAALAAGVAAQGGSTATGQSSSKTQDQQNQVTVTGCLQNADMAGAGAAGTAGSTSGSAGTSGAAGQSTASGGAQFMLTNATMAKTSASGTSGTATSGTGTSGTASGTSTSGTSGAAGANRFLLVGGNQQNLKQYLNSQVEVQGRLDQSKGAAGAGSTATGTGSTTSGSATAGQSSGRMADVQRLQVTSVRQIATTCTGR
jgi:hypothetical protein